MERLLRQAETLFLWPYTQKFEGHALVCFEQLGCLCDGTLDIMAIWLSVERPQTTSKIDPATMPYSQWLYVHAAHHLHSLAKAHVISQDAVETIVMKSNHPAQALQSQMQ